MTIDMTFERREELIRRDEREEGIAQGREEGIAQGCIQTYVGLVKDGIMSIELAANRLGISEEEFKTYLDN